ncbi:MAG: 3-hydroxy-9,10-secoandrosta,3,5(10)-triene-9,17-dione monooxygenase reductase component [Solirubrobacterales bacterium]|jgi:3-hydroxy-9,10-secoandrosta-1,3,5(10)-triene-9,17-dione monooxygenase reductase component|nr:3-hydroxy-9,10-secoandrosta,3,5(10)-triene-9,17-dione monooxygenase reductase component [Solirubrobacterales bacterium]
MPSPPPDPDAFRRALGQLPTGVTVVTARGDGGLSGATANAVCSLSLEPMLMLACLDRGSRTLRSVEQAGRFAINVLAAGSEGLARRFAGKQPEEEKWVDIGHSERSEIPALDEAIVWIGCELRDVLGGGDHVIVTGAVIDLAERDGEPLVFHRGLYRGLGQG